MSARDFSTQTSALLDTLCEHLFSRLQTGEDVNVNLDAEETLYLRFNNNRIRQNTDVTQRVLDIRYQASGRTIDHGITLSGQIDADCRSMDAILERCRHDATVLPQDPFQVPVQNHGSSREIFQGQLLAPAALIAAIVEPAGGCDLVGFYAGGVVISANRNSKGQNHWFETENFFFDYSLYSGPASGQKCLCGILLECPRLGGQPGAQQGLAGVAQASFATGSTGRLPQLFCAGGLCRLARHDVLGRPVGSGVEAGSQPLQKADRKGVAAFALALGC